MSREFSVHVKRDELLAKLKANRENHRKIFLEAQEGFRKEVVKQLDQALKDAREGRRFRNQISIDAPVDQTSDYDRVISMLSMAVDETIELNENDYSAYVLDQWRWRYNFLTSNAKYSESATKALGE